MTRTVPDLPIDPPEPVSRPDIFDRADAAYEAHVEDSFRDRPRFAGRLRALATLIQSERDMAELHERREREHQLDRNRFAEAWHASAAKRHRREVARLESVRDGLLAALDSPGVIDQAAARLLDVIGAGDDEQDAERWDGMS